MRWLLLLWSLSACGQPGGQVRAADFPDDPPECVGDDDCVLSSFHGACCPTCPGPQRVWSRAALVKAQHHCAEERCPSLQQTGVGEPLVRCEPEAPATLRGVRCRRSRCAGVR